MERETPALYLHYSIDGHVVHHNKRNAAAQDVKSEEL